jgi:hypothetical protein
MTKLGVQDVKAEQISLSEQLTSTEILSCEVIIKVHHVGLARLMSEQHNYGDPQTYYRIPYAFAYTMLS